MENYLQYLEHKLQKKPDQFTQYLEKLNKHMIDDVDTLKQTE